MTEQIFVSYSHADKIWREAIETTFGSGVYATRFKLWFDSEIEPGAAWRQKISAAIADSRIALLLVSSAYLNSKFIANSELPMALKRREAGAMTILWVPIEKIPAVILQAAGLADIQSAEPLSDPLSEMNAGARKIALLDIASKLLSRVAVDDDTSDDLKSKLNRVLSDSGTVIGEPIAAGDYSIFYRAKQREVDVAIKALVPTPSRAWLNEAFVRRANAVRKISNSTAIGIRNVIDDPLAHGVIMDYIDVPTLEARLRQGETLSCEVVAVILAQLVRVAGHLHAMAGQHIVGPVRPSHVHYDSSRRKAFISLVPIANETLDSCRDHPTRLFDAAAMSYLSPELYRGKPVDDRVDQYYLGLLALELLQGKQPVPVKAFADLEAKKQFFESPRSHFDRNFRLNHPAFSFVLARMLEFNPEHRWPTTDDQLLNSLQQIADGEVPKAVRKYVGNQYKEVLSKHAGFFGSFYEALLASSDEIRTLFKDVSIGQQSDKLRKAMGNLLNFSEDMSVSSLAPQVDDHVRLGVKSEHFGLFRDAFLQAVGKIEGTDEYSQDAWRSILDPALDHMRKQIDLARG
jgi:hemoglobin-like flavoprotein